MAKIVIAGNAVVVTSALTLEDIKKVEKYRPEALILKGGEDKKEAIFGIQSATHNGGITKYGATFADESRDEHKFAQITMCLEGVTGDVKEYVADTFGAAVDMINQLETTLPGVIEEIDAKKKAVIDSITIAQ